MNNNQYNKLTRIYITDDLSVGEIINIEENLVHYLKNVLRKNVGDLLRIFNGRDGEYLAEIITLTKNKASITIKEKIAEQKKSADIWAVASVIKKIDIQIEKSSELGTAKFIAVKTDKSVIHKIKHDRLQAIAIEAAEQCERLDIMEVSEQVIKLEEVIKANPERIFILCLERLDSQPILQLAENISAELLAVVIGAEGGFSPEEISHLEKFTNVKFASLGKNILRAETALITALSAITLTLDNK